MGVIECSIIHKVDWDKVCSFKTDQEIGYFDLWLITYLLFASSQCLVTIPAGVSVAQYNTSGSVWSPPDCFLVLPMPFATVPPMFGGAPMTRSPHLNTI